VPGNSPISSSSSSPPKPSWAQVVKSLPSERQVLAGKAPSKLVAPVVRKPYSPRPVANLETVVVGRVKPGLTLQDLKRSMAEAHFQMSQIASISHISPTTLEFVVGKSYANGFRKRATALGWVVREDFNPLVWNGSRTKIVSPLEVQTLACRRWFRELGQAQRLPEPRRAILSSFFEARIQGIQTANPNFSFTDTLGREVVKPGSVFCVPVAPKQVTPSPTPSATLRASSVGPRPVEDVEMVSSSTPTE
jgi:hypothetical protein